MLSGLASFSRALDRYFPPPQLLLPAAAGVDVSDASIKWLKLEERGGELTVASWGSIPLSPGIVEGGLVRDVEALARGLRAVKPSLGASVVHAALPEEAAYVFGMRAPAGSGRSEILSMIEFEFNGRVPIPPSGAVYDYSVIEQSVGNPEKQIGVVVFPFEVSESYGNAFERSGLELLSLEVEARSIARAVSSCDAREPITLSVDFGSTRTSFAVLKRGIPIFTSTVEIGGETILSALERTLSLDRQAAERFCNEEGLLAEGASKSGTEAIVPTASALADEIERHYRWWDTRRNDQGKQATPIGRVVLVGGNANTRGLPEYIASRIHAPIEVADVWRHVRRTDNYIPPIDKRESLRYATAIGLALRDR